MPRQHVAGLQKTLRHLLLFSFFTASFTTSSGNLETARTARQNGAEKGPVAGDDLPCGICNGCRFHLFVSHTPQERAVLTKTGCAPAEDGDGGTTAAKCAASNFKKRDPNYNSLTIVSAKWCGVTGHHSNVSTLGIAKAPRDRSNHESLCVISTKDPTEQLLATISAVEEFYPEFDIVVVDSDSNQTLSVNRTYEAVHRNHENVDVYLARNQNWEYGAWDFAFKGSQTSHTCFMFIQDSLTPTSRIPGFSLKKCKRKIYSFHYASVLADGGYLDRLREVYRHTKLSFISDLADDYEFVGGAHSAFITDRLTSKFMLKLEKAYRDKGLSKTKIDSWLAERTTGIMAAVSGKARVDLTPHFEKKHNGRDFP